MKIFSMLLGLIKNILPLALALFAIISISKMQSISKRSKVILSIVILFFLFMIKIWRVQGDYENTLMLRSIFKSLIDIGQIVLFIFAIKWILKTETISKTLKIILIVIISVCVCIMLSGYSNEIIDEKYTEIKEMVDNKSLIGLSEEKVVELLGDPGYKYTDNRSKLKCTYYTYGAGTIRKEWFWGRCYSTEYYQLNVDFDENSKVKYAYIKESP